MGSSVATTVSSSPGGHAPTPGSEPPTCTTYERPWASLKESPTCGLSGLPGNAFALTKIGFLPALSRSSTPGLPTYLQTQTLTARCCDDRDSAFRTVCRHLGALGARAVALRFVGGARRRVVSRRVVVALVGGSRICGSFDSRRVRFRSRRSGVLRHHGRRLFGLYGFGRLRRGLGCGDGVAGLTLGDGGLREEHAGRNHREYEQCLFMTVDSIRIAPARNGSSRSQGGVLGCVSATTSGSAPKPVHLRRHPSGVRHVERRQNGRNFGDQGKFDHEWPAGVVRMNYGI